MAKQMIACIYKFSLEKENNKMAKLEGKVALITGAAVGLGEGSQLHMRNMVQN